MKVYMGPYKRWFGPYQLAQTIFFWAKTKDEFGFDDYPKWVHRVGTFFADGTWKQEPEQKVGERRKFLDFNDNKKTWLFGLLSWIHEKQQRKIKIRIDPYDCWNMADNLNLIILPMLIELKRQKPGSPHVDDEDVPEHLRSTNDPKLETYEDWDVDDFHHARWEWVLDELIAVFTLLVDEDREHKFFSGEADYELEKREDGMSLLVEGPNHTYDYDREGLQKENDRIANGLRLFGKYYQGLWS